MKRAYRLILMTFLIFSATLGLSEEIRGSGPGSDRPSPSMLTNLVLGTDDSLFVDTSNCKTEYTDSRIRAFNQYLDTRLFSRYKCMRYANFFKRGEHQDFPDAMLTFIEFTKADGKRIGALMEKKYQGYFVLKVFNRYTWYQSGSTLILVERFSREPKPIFSQIDSMAIAVTSSQMHATKRIPNNRIPDSLEHRK